MGHKIYHDMLMPLYDSMPSFMNFEQLLDLLELRNQAPQHLPESHGAMVFEIHPHFLNGIYASTDGHIYHFTTHFGVPEHVHVV